MWQPSLLSKRKAKALSLRSCLHGRAENMDGMQPGSSCTQRCPALSERRSNAASTKVITNLLTNAVKFTQHGEVSVQITLQSRFPHPTIRIEVVDTRIDVLADCATAWY
eukprot:TRINITY_DN5045_c0_g1_i3.p2 TRINITY_DN5045_c0_g1~~TRINITY_DN5045_c0_g1_i3.p2  ORF type:complete len:109 (-),score=17.77 TRINITY_DN5045_c0_g1_i3:57-383(-)